MSLHPHLIAPVPAHTARVARAACPTGPPSLPCRDALGPLLQDEAVRAVSDAALRLKEALSLGFRTVLLPAGNAAEAAAFPDLSVVPLRSVEELLAKA